MGFLYECSKMIVCHRLCLSHKSGMFSGRDDRCNTDRISIPHDIHAYMCILSHLIEHLSFSSSTKSLVL